MPPRKRTRPDDELCQVCKDAASKYRCSQCPIRYCSVACYKKHKEAECSATKTDIGAAPAPMLLDSCTGVADLGETEGRNKEEEVEAPLKPLTDVAWPPEPDAGIFTDPLKKDDPKPLRREELMRIATSPQLRRVLATPKLAQMLRILDALPTPNARSSCLARLLGVDEISLSKPGQESLLSQRDSPPPLGDLLNALSGNVEDKSKAIEETGWWLGREGERIWIGEEEQRLMRIWAGVVVQSIDGEGQGDEWGRGSLGWEV